MAQLVCTNQNCRVVLMYPRGATQVQCSVCHTINCAVAVRGPIFPVAHCPAFDQTAPRQGLVRGCRSCCAPV